MNISDAIKVFYVVLKKYGKLFLKMCGNPALDNLTAIAAEL